MAFIRGTGGGGYSTNSYSISTGTIAHEVKKLSQEYRQTGPAYVPPVLNRADNASAQRWAGQAMMYGHQNTGYRPYGQQSVADLLSPEFFNSLNRNSRLTLANSYVSQEAQFGPNVAYAGTNYVANVSGSNVDPSVIAHESLHVLGMRNPGAVNQFMENVPANSLEAARNSYLGRAPITDIPSMLEHAAVWKTWTLPQISNFMAPGSQEQFAEVLSHQNLPTLIQQNPKLKESLLAFFNSESLATLSGTMNRNPDGTISLDQGAPKTQNSLVPAHIGNAVQKGLGPKSLTSEQWDVFKKVLDKIDPTIARMLTALGI